MTTAKISEIVQSVVVSGSMIARDEVLVAPEVDGLAIVELLAEEGDRVAAGQVLARLSRTTLEVQKAQNDAQIARAEAAIAQSNAQIVEAEANLVQANNAFDRTKALREQRQCQQRDLRPARRRRPLGRARLNSSRQALAISTADLALAKAQGRDIEVKLARTEIKAPKAGIVSRRNARLGAMAAMAAAEPLFRIIADGAIELQADVAEVELPGLKLGQPVAVTPAGASVALGGRDPADRARGRQAVAARPRARRAQGQSAGRDRLLCARRDRDRPQERGDAAACRRSPMPALARRCRASATAR
jgi:HlyD family secretion protein